MSNLMSNLWKDGTGRLARAAWDEPAMVSVLVARTTPSSHASFQHLGLVALLVVLLSLASLKLHAQITPDNPAISKGQSVSLVATIPGTWSLCSGCVGTLTVIDSTHATYTAPASIVANNAKGGCPVFANDSIWNTPVNSLPVHPNSGEWVNAFTTANPLLSHNYSLVLDATTWGTSLATNSTPTHSVNTYYNTPSTPYTGFPIPTGTALSRQAGSYNYPGAYIGGFDSHIFAVNTDTCQMFDSYSDVTPLGSSYTYTCQVSGQCNAQSVAKYKSGTYTSFLPASGQPYQGTDAGGTPIAINLTDEELVNNSIHHVIDVTVAAAQFQRNTYLWPATATAGGVPFYSGGAFSVGVTMPPIGARFRLKSGVVPATVCSSATGLALTYCEEIVVALQNYGGIITDTGLSLNLEVDMDCTLDPACSGAMTAFNGASLVASNIEFVDESSLQYGQNSYQVTPYGTAGYGNSIGGSGSLTPGVIPANTAQSVGTITIPNQDVGTYLTVSTSPALPSGVSAMAFVSTYGVGQVYLYNSNSSATSSIGATTFTLANGGTQNYVTPGQQAVVTNGTQSASIGLLGGAIVLPNLHQQSISMVTGSYSWTLPTALIPSFGLTGISQAVTWSKVSGGGSVTGAVYTPPANNLTYTNAILKCTSNVDSNVSTLLYIYLLPPMATNGHLYLDTGSSTNTTDAGGNVWLADIGADGGGSITGTTDYPHWNQTNPAATAVYESHAGTGLSDIGVQVVVPNNNYTVHILYGIESNGHCGSGCATFAGLSGYSQQTFGPVEFETQGTPKLHLDPNYAKGYLFEQPTDIYVPAVVSNNILTVYERSMGSAAFPQWPPCANCTQIKIPTISGLELIPTTNPSACGGSSSCWAIDVGPACASLANCSQAPQTTIAAGQTLLPFKVTDWFTGDSDVTSPSWSVSSSVGATITSSGALTLPSGNYLANQPIAVTARGARHSANFVVYTAGSRAAINPVPRLNHYRYARAITINASKVASTLTKFPILVSISDPTLATVANGGRVQNPNGWDIVFSSNASGTPTLLNWEVEQYSATNGTLVAHVQVPTISSAANTVIYMFYGNPAIATRQNTPSSAWNSNYLAVYHMTNLLSDSTANNNTAVNGNTSYVTSTPGLFANSEMISSIYDLQLPVGAIPSTKGSIELWANPTSFNNTPPDLFQLNGSGNFMDFFGQDGHTGFKTNSTDSRIVSTQIPILNSWHWYTYTWDSSIPYQATYMDGVLDKSSSAAFTPNPPQAGYAPGYPNYNYLGLFDEARFSNIALTPGWIATQYNSYSSPGTFLTLGAEQPN